jgi:hypothetical protein
MNAEKYPAKSAIYNEYLRLTAKLETRGARLKKRSLDLSRLRLIIFLGGLSVFLTLYFTDMETLSYIAAGAAAIAFMIAAHFHSRLEEGRTRLAKWIELKKLNIDRMNLNWEKIPASGVTSSEAGDVEEDLNIVGHESLFELINLARSNEGKQRLRAFLTPRDVKIEETLKRQTLVRELAKNGRLMGKSILASSLTGKKELDANELHGWLKNLPHDKKLKGVTYFLCALAPVNLVLMLLGYYDILPALWGITLPLYMGVSYFMGKQVKELYENASYLSGELGKLIAVFKVFEKYPLKKDSPLTEFFAPFKSAGEKPSRYLGRIKMIAYILELRGNPLIWLTFSAIAPLDFILALRFEKNKAGILAKLPEWAGVWHDAEALFSLANFARINPHYTFPEIINSKEPLFEAGQAGHPLLHDGTKVCNDFILQGHNIILITGSNMSGKSAFIKTIGVNMCLAYAGGSVDAGHLKLSLFDLFTCIKVSDSVTDGISYFYAEVKRLRQLLERVNSGAERSTFFLIDEIFKGTNNIERNSGSRMFIKSLAGKNAAGMITTHDLELTKLADEIGSIHNYHFKDEVRAGKMHFDYAVHEGPCPTTNALKIITGEFGEYLKN